MGQETPLRFDDMAVGDLNPFTFDFGSPGLVSTGCGMRGKDSVPPWTTAADPVTATTVMTSSANGLAIIGGPGIALNQVTVWLQANDSDQDFLIQCQVNTLLGRRATRTARVYVKAIMPGF